ncbi:carbonate dehydratase [Annulohypoxylon truncatum]|uniref:carbonate dehydratase n=1 Tax=Annulohypoxylon truncatum TaxID=327061 RepID=UPI002008D187|nr:carbonate dehydratase [Annulohypoxylon truncatum]KAI1211158.1 carbonate dehydratase [Annulohypoxylon truncatum]
MTSPIQKNLVEKNAGYASHFTKGDLALPPAKHYLILTCMDARIDPAAAFGIDLGDAHVIRNAGASARDGQRSIIISEQLLGTKEIILIKHTGCGMLTFSNEDAHGLVKKNLGPSAAVEIATLDFLPFSNLEDAVREDIAYLRKSATVPEDVVISGWIYEVETGKVRQVV